MTSFTPGGVHVLTIWRLAADAPQGWSTGYVIAMLCVGSTLLVCFVWWQSRAQFPLMPLAIWQDRTFSAVRGPPLDQRGEIFNSIC